MGYRADLIQNLLTTTGWKIESNLPDTPTPYLGGIYDELKLSAYVIIARAQ